MKKIKPKFRRHNKYPVLKIATTEAFVRQLPENREDVNANAAFKRIAEHMIKPARNFQLLIAVNDGIFDNVDTALKAAKILQTTPDLLADSLNYNWLYKISFPSAQKAQKWLNKLPAAIQENIELFVFSNGRFVKWMKPLVTVEQKQPVPKEAKVNG